MTCMRTLAGGVSRAAVLVLSGLALGACQPGAASNQAAASDAADAPAPQAALALAAGPAAPIVPAPAANALPAAAPASLALADTPDEYGPADDATAANAGFGDAPPDYAFSYSGEQAWVWRGDDQSMRVAEPLPGGGLRYYYYRPGDDAPYLVRDASDSFGYANGALVAVYDSHGDPIPAGSLGAQAALAGSYLARAQQLYAASRRRQQEAVTEASWEAQRATVQSESAQWNADAASNQAWAAYHAAHQQQEDAEWSAERYRREAEAARFAQSIHDTAQAQKDLQAAEKDRARADGLEVTAQGSVSSSQFDPRAAAETAKQTQHDVLEAEKLAARQANQPQHDEFVAQASAARQAAAQAKLARQVDAEMRRTEPRANAGRPPGRF
jgi:hypothetical protein